MFSFSVFGEYVDVWRWSWILLVLVVLYFLSGWLRMARLAWSMPGPPALPGVGNALLIADTKNLVLLGNSCYEKYGPVMRVWASVMPMVVVSEPQYVQAILGSHKNTNKITFYKLLHNFLGQGLITSSGEKWKTHRKWIQPWFNIRIMESFIASFADSSNMLIEKLRAKESLKNLNIVSLVNESILDILSASVLGIPVQHTRDWKAESPFRKGKVFAQQRITHPWLLFNWIYEKTDLARHEISQKDQLREFTRKIVVARRAERQNATDSEDTGATDKDSDKKSLLDFMLDVSETNDRFQEDDILNELITFMLAGQDSVGAAVAFCLFFLGQHQDIQDRVIQELDTIFQDDSERAPTLQDLRQMSYLEQCLKETLRIYPSVPIIARRINEDIVMGDYTLPTGCEVLISPYVVHRLPHIYPEPDRFDPDRFLPQHVLSRHPYAYIPFSAGPRNCVGYQFSLLEMKTVISRILRNYRLSPVPGREKVDISYRITLRSKGGICLTLTPRK